MADWTGLEGDDIVLKCEVSPKEAEVQWYLNKKPVAEDGQVTMESNGSERQLCIKGATVQHNGIVSALAGKLQTDGRLTVKGKLN